MATKQRLGLIAGRGELPFMLAKSAIEAGQGVLAVALCKEAELELKSLEGVQVYRYAPTEVFQIIDLLKNHSITDLVFIGKVPKLEFFRSAHKLNPLLIQRLSRLPNLHDDTLHFALLDFLENENGFKVANQTAYLQKYFPEAQIFTKQTVPEELLEEIDYGLKLAKSSASLDIGQTVVVQQKSILAIEAIEGTNVCIRRAKALVRWTSKHRITVCKVSKPNQDQRFDVPVVGLETVKQLRRGDCLAIEARETMFLNQAEAIDYANSKGIHVLAR